MAEQRHTFRFRLPWLQLQPTPETAPAASRPNQSQAPQRAPAASGPNQTQTPETVPAASRPKAPSRPAAPVQKRQSRPQAAPQAKASVRVEHPPSSSVPRTGTKSQSATRSATQAAPKIVSSAGRSSRPQQVAQVPHKSATPSRGATQPDTSPSSPASLETSKSIHKKQPAAKLVSESKEEPRKQEASEKSPIKSELLEGQNKQEQASTEEKVLKASQQPPVPDSDNELLSTTAEKLLKIDGTTSRGTAEKEMVKGVSHEEPKKKEIMETQATGSKKPPAAEKDQQEDQHPKEEKEISATSERIGRKAESKIRDHDNTARHNHIRRHTMTEENPFSIITLAGENTGATMHLNSESSDRQKLKSVHIHRRYKTANPDEKIKEEIITDDGEGSSSRGRQSTLQDEPGKNIFANNNVQGINNSLVLNSSVSEGNPGVRIVLSHKPVEPVKIDKEKTIPETRKAQVSSSTPGERIEYAPPKTKRRCLRGLLLESSESDADNNTQKQRRHGCRVVCKDNNA